MRLVALSLGIVALLLGAVALVNRLVDPFEDFYDRNVLVAAADGSPPCLIASNPARPGRTSLRFKEDIFERRQARLVVIGTSRIFGIGPWPEEKHFANLGINETVPAMLATYFRRLHEIRPAPLTVYLGTEPWWFNRNWEPALSNVFDSAPFGRLRDLLNRRTLKESLTLAARSPRSLLESWREYRVGNRCVLANSPRVAEGNGEAWAVDGTLLTRWQLRPDIPRPESNDYVLDRFRDWYRLDPNRLTQLDAALRLAKDYGWKVVGLAAPFPARFVERLATAPQSARGWRAYGRTIPRLFERHGFPFLDLRRVSAVPCAEDSFDYGNDGSHPNPTCSMRLRQHLDQAAAKLNSYPDCGQRRAECRRSLAKLPKPQFRTAAP